MEEKRGMEQVEQTGEEQLPVTDQAQAPEPEPQPEPQIDPYRLNMLLERIRGEQSLSKGFIGGAVGAAIGAAIWATITILTEYQVGYMALGVGYLAGLGVKTMGKGIDRPFQYLGAALSLVGCMAGNLAVVLILVSGEIGLEVAELVSRLTPGIVFGIYRDTFDFMDLLFYALAISVGYRTSLRKIPEAELEKLVQQ